MPIPKLRDRLENKTALLSIWQSNSFKAATSAHEPIMRLCLKGEVAMLENRNAM
jgi:hypothetical protein